MTSIDSLLSQRNAQRIGSSGDASKALERLDITRFIAENYQKFDKIRTHLFHPNHYKTVKSPQEIQIIIDFFEAKNWIKSVGNNAWKLNVNDELRFYLAGGWLEELVYFAHKEAGVDELYFGQKILWDVDGIKGKNEIDILARRGDLLSFTSCKTISVEKSPKHMSRLRRFLTETDYWNIHFANDKGRALLVVTADFIDELRQNKHRYPQLLSRSTILDVSMLGLEQLEWNVLVESINNHWN